MPFTHGYALLIGIDQHREAELALPLVAQDVQAFHAVLTHPERCGYQPQHVHTLLGKQATRDGILEGLAWLKGRLAADPQATAVIYYSGHGWQDEETDPPTYYFIPYDTHKARARYTALRAADFAAEVSGMRPARLLVLLDCCHARGMEVKDAALDFTPAVIPAGMFLGGEKAVQFDAAAKGLKALAQGRGRAVLNACQKEQRSYLRPDGKMGVFTYHLIEALTGHAQPQEGAKEVLTSDIAGHVMRRVPESARKEGWQQDPEVCLSGVFPVALLLGGVGLAKDAFPPDPIQDALPAVPASYYAQASDQAVVVQGNGNTVVQQGGVVVKGDVKGDIVTGQKREINLGGGDYFEKFESNYAAGNQQIKVEHRNLEVNAPVTGSTLITGDKNKPRLQIDLQGEPTLERFQEVLDALSQALPQAGLPAEEQAEVQEHLNKVKQQAQNKQPNRRVILSRLDSVVAFLANAATVATAAPQFVEWGQKLVEWAKVLFS